MGQTLALAPDLSIVDSLDRDTDPAGITHLPSDWTVVDRVTLDDIVIDHVVVGPNGVFSITLDPNSTPAAIEHDGLYRDDDRVTSPVKNALLAAHALRRRVGNRLFAYPLLVTSLLDPPGQLDRLRAVPAGGIAEAIWSHPGMPLTRSQRVETEWMLRSLAR